MENPSLHPDESDQTTPDRPESDRVESGAKKTAEAVSTAVNLPAFTIENQGDTWILHLKTLNPSKEDLAELMARIKDSPVRNVIADLSGTKNFGTLVLIALLAVWKRVRSRGGNLSLRGVSATGLEILHVTRFDTFWEIEPSAEV